MQDEHIIGLTGAEVAERRARGEGETGARSVTKSVGAILRENICTLFNALNFAIAIILFMVGAYTNMLFIAIIILNIVIGIAQELKAKKLVDELTILNQPRAVVLRDGAETEIEASGIVKDDIIVLDAGRQICNDAVVVSGALEVNESLLTGESDSVDKTAGAQLFSGSSVISGRCYARVTHVGDANYANSLINEVRKEKRVHSELLDSMRKVTKFTSFLIIPLGIALFAEATLLRHAAMYDSVVASAAALLGMLPKGLVLLISVSLATGVIRLAKSRILVQNIYALETLAHVDTLCLDKTGTLTDGNMAVEQVVPLGGIADADARRLIGAYLHASEDNNATITALREYCAAASPAGAPEPAARFTVFSRVTPKQKRQLVQAMQRAGHQVAMTGDGVNDLLALREADCSIAIASGSDAARQIAQIVLLESDFTHLPQVVLEGRKVVNNVTRTAAVFFIKTIYSVLVSFFCLALNIPFPFIPIQITLVDACIEAWPSFLTIFESDTARIRGRFLPTALGKAAPFALAVTGMIVAFSLIAPFPEAQNRTVMYALLIAMSMIAVVRSCVPFTRIRAFVCATMALGTPLALLILPHLFEVTAVSAPMWGWFAVSLAIMAAAAAAIIGVQRALAARGGQRPRRH